MSLFTELKRRNVIRMAGLYLVGAWLLTQVAGTVLPMFGTPDWLPRSIVILLAIGFIPMLVFSWAFELTPHGLKRDEDVRPEESIAPQTARRLNRMIIGVLVLALAYFGFDKFVLTPRRDAALVAATEKSVAVRTSAESKSATNTKSVAVLAFANLSDDKGSEYFSDGVSEELLTVLQKIPGLHVAARTSAFSFKGKNATAQEIGQKLDVAHLVEGSVRKSGNNVRIAARLTQADTGEQLWSENYTRDLKDVFAVQTELAQTIVGQLRGQLTGGAADPGASAAIQAQVQAAEKGGTKNVEAYQYYLQGQFFARQFSSGADAQAITSFRRAVEIDPGFALAWAAFSRTFSTQASWDLPDRPVAEIFEDARQAADRALALEKDLAEAYMARAVVQSWHDFDWRGGDVSARRAAQLAPSNAMAWSLVARSDSAAGRLDQAIEHGRQSIELDPLNPEIRINHGYSLTFARRFAEAEGEFRRVLEINPTATTAEAQLSVTLLLQGRVDEAAAAAAKETTPWARPFVVAIVRWAQGQRAEADAALQVLEKSYAQFAAYQVAQVYAYRGETDRAFAWLDRAYRQRDTGLSFVKSDPLLDSLHRDPRWREFLVRMRLTDDQLK